MNYNYILKTMKKILLFFMLCISLFVNAQHVETPQLKFVMQIRAKCPEGLMVGKTPQGVRQIAPITGGTFQGPEMKGEVLSGGADYQLHHVEEKRIDMEAIYSIKTDDNILIFIRNIGFCTWANGKLEFRTTPIFNVPEDSRLAWMNNTQFICTRNKEEMQGGVILDVWKVE